MEEKFDLESYLAQGVESIVSGILKTTAKDPRESRFMLGFAAQSRRADRLRRQAAEDGLHVPPFLIASITTRCNLHCQGCYARANHSCFDGGAETSPEMLAAARWNELFTQAEELGVSFILLAGGEPLLRRDVLEAAGVHPKIVFPIFTNGTLLDGDCLALLERRRNLVPVLSIEGEQTATDRRRGEGVYDRLHAAMADLAGRGLLFGASVTVTRQNAAEVLSDAFAAELRDSGCRVVIYVEYVPVDRASRELAPDESTRAQAARRLCELRLAFPELLAVSFPGDERESGGCLAAGRGFFHINPWGGAEPCPFSPYSDCNVAHASLAQALRSPFFQKLREQGNLEGEHIGGCVLFEREEQVRALLRK